MDSETQKIKLLRSNGHKADSDPMPESSSGTLEQHRSQVPAEPSEKVTRALVQRIEREQMGMVPSLAREAAKNSHQATLDIHRANQTVRIAMTVGAEVRDSLIDLNEQTKRSIAGYPELEMDFVEMQTDTSRLLKQLNKVVAVGYLRRYHQLGPSDSDER